MQFFVCDSPEEFDAIESEVNQLLKRTIPGYNAAKWADPIPSRIEGDPRCLMPVPQFGSHREALSAEVKRQAHRTNYLMSKLADIDTEDRDWFAPPIEDYATP